VSELNLADVAPLADEAPLLAVTGLGKRFGDRIACRDVSFELWPGEVLGVVGESGSGKTTLLNCVSAQLQPDEGRVAYQQRDGRVADLFDLSEPARRLLMRTDWGFVHQNPRDGLRLGLSAGANIGERLMAVGARHYGDIREAAIDWLAKVEIEIERVDDVPLTFSGGMQQRLQIARCLAQDPAALMMDEPFGALDAMTRQSLQDELLEIARATQATIFFVTHDLEEAIYLGDRVIGLKPHPGRVGLELEIGLPRPRDQVATRESPEFLRLRRALYDFIQVTEGGGAP